MQAIILTVFFLLGIASGYAAMTCGLNEHFSTCATLCPRTCNNQSEVVCPAVCVNGCVCNEGYVRASVDGPCVHETTCERVLECGPNEKFSICATKCPRTCDNSTPKFCPLICLSGCVCKDDYIRRTINGECISQVSCRQECKENEEYRECGTLCPGTCSEPVKNCPRICSRGCFCKEGFTLHDKTKKCVKLESCPKTN